MEALLELAAVGLGPLLKAFWILAAGSVIVTILPVPLPQAFKDAVTLSACRGKLWQTKPNALGFLRDWSVPQRWFLHFYVLGAACNAATLFAYACSCCSAGPAAITVERARVLLALCLFQFHLVRRAYETAVVMRYPADARMHGIAYAFGLSYYGVVPLSLLPADWLADLPAIAARGVPTVGCTADAAVALKTLGLHGPGVLVLAVVGAAVFLGGSALQCASHIALARLSAGRQQLSEKTAYRIPKGGVFELVSCPHYLAEIVIYLGLALVTGGSINTLLMLVWVAVNLVLAAGATQAWYHAHFKTYPKGRRALVPYVW